MNDENLQNGVKFSSERQPASRGRKPNRVKHLIEELDLSKDDVTAVFLTLIADKKEAELLAISQDVEEPMILRAYIAAMLKDFKKGDVTTVREMLTYIFGPNAQKVQLTSTVGIAPITPEEEAEFQKALAKIIPQIVYQNPEGDD